MAYLVPHPGPNYFAFMYASPGVAYHQCGSPLQWLTARGLKSFQPPPRPLTTQGIIYMGQSAKMALSLLVQSQQGRPPEAKSTSFSEGEAE